MAAFGRPSGTDKNGSFDVLLGLSVKLIKGPFCCDLDYLAKAKLKSPKSRTVTIGIDVRWRGDTSEKDPKTPLRLF